MDPQPEIHLRGDRDTAYEHIGRVIVTCPARRHPEGRASSPSPTAALAR